MTTSLSDHAMTVLRDLVRHGPRPSQEINAGVTDKFRKEGLAEFFEAKTPYPTRKGMISWIRATDRARQIVAAGKC